MAKMTIEKDITRQLFDDITNLIEQSRKQVATVVNSEITILYWRVGKAIREQILKDQRAEYGNRIVINLSQKLTERYGRGWSKEQLWNCLRTAERIRAQKTIYALSKELSWTHIRTLVSIKDDLKMEFYTALCRNEKWDTRTLDERIDSLLFERTALSKKPEKLLKKEIQILKSKGTVTPDLVFRDPYFLSFLGLKASYSEKDIESAILNQLQEFIVEMGNDFAFLARQKKNINRWRRFQDRPAFLSSGIEEACSNRFKIGKIQSSSQGANGIIPKMVR